MPGHGASISSTCAPPSLVTERRSSGSKRKSSPAAASTDSSSESNFTEPATTSRTAASFTWCSPSCCPGERPISTIRLSPSSECSTTGERLPCGVSISPSFQWRTPDTCPHAGATTHGPSLDSRVMSTFVDAYGLGPLQTNCYVVRASREASEAVVVDPGGDAADLRLELARAGAACAAILITHGHFDHVGGVADLAEGTGAPVYMPEGERERLERYGEFAPVGMPGRSYTPDHFLAGGETIEVAGLTFECVRSLADRYPPETVIYPGHGPQTTLGDELARNPFLAELRA